MGPYFVFGDGVTLIRVPVAPGNHTLPRYPGCTALPCVMNGTRADRASSRPFFVHTVSMPESVSF